MTDPAILGDIIGGVLMGLAAIRLLVLAFGGRIGKKDDVIDKEARERHL
jgi:hypothetical protein